MNDGVFDFDEYEQGLVKNGLQPLKQGHYRNLREDGWRYFVATSETTIKILANHLSSYDDPIGSARLIRFTSCTDGKRYQLDRRTPEKSAVCIEMEKAFDLDEYTRKNEKPCAFAAEKGTYYLNDGRRVHAVSPTPRMGFDAFGVMLSRFFKPETISTFDAFYFTAKDGYRYSLRRGNKYAVSVAVTRTVRKPSSLERLVAESRTQSKKKSPAKKTAKKESPEHEHEETARRITCDIMNAHPSVFAMVKSWMGQNNPAEKQLPQTRITDDMSGDDICEDV